MTASLRRTITDSDVLIFAGVSGDLNPVHLDSDFARKRSIFGKRVAHGMLCASFISAVFGTLLPGPGWNSKKNKRTHSFFYLFLVLSLFAPPMHFLVLSCL